MKIPSAALPDIRRCSLFPAGHCIRHFLLPGGVDFNKEQFLEDLKRFYSVSALAHHWANISPVNADDLEEDFLWRAAIVLWKRLAPDIVNSEKIDDLVEKGDDLIYE